ncbi:hypothetical protein AOL_s00007g183 [Orbilia oligospora ATCC 24927]|uniref:Uncharacterized protein n=2 Tax=Orbilia oligospora TaxID=2813651 RepID=G1X1M4_ARTOA|nr:hypothetical protein AOL_s00007g183 [Orbilia oligospora ATCC 24927]EGX52847.1 hypothetical protein AOL_s00007g183 [Orbilia oligospora ATCC 24927]
MIKLLPKSPTKTTPQAIISPSSAITQVLNIPELLEQILFFILTSPELDTPARCKTANILRSTSSIWAGTIDSSPTLSALAFRNRKASPTNPTGGAAAAREAVPRGAATAAPRSEGDLNIPFLQSLKYELSEIEQIKYYHGNSLGLKELKKIKNSQKIIKPSKLTFQKLRKALRFTPQKTNLQSTKYLASDVLIIQPLPPKTINTYLHFSGWGCSEWVAWLRRFSRPDDFHKFGNTIEFKYWYKITDSSGGNAITGADVINALTKVLTEFYTFNKGLFEIIHIELAVGNISPSIPSSPIETPTEIEYMYRWYLWHPEKFGGESSVDDIVLSYFFCIFHIVSVGFRKVLCR